MLFNCSFNEKIRIINIPLITGKKICIFSLKIVVKVNNKGHVEPLSHELIKKHFVHDVKTVSSEDDELYQIVDSVDSVLAILHDSHE